MAKQLKELRIFSEGTISSPAASDVPDEAAVYSKNIESLDEQGKLKGTKKDVPIRSDSTLEGLNRYYYWFNSNAPITGEDIFYQVKLFGNTVTGDNYTNASTNTAVQQEVAQKLALESFCAKLRLQASIKEAKAFSLVYNVSGSNTTPPLQNLGAILVSGIDSTQTTFDVTDADAIAISSIIKLTQESTIEYMRVLNIEDSGDNKKLSVERAVQYNANDEDLSYEPASAFNSIAAISVGLDYNGIEVTYDAALEEITGPKYSHSSALSTHAEQINLTDYLEVNGRNLLFVNSRDDNSNFTKTNLVIYDQKTSADPVEYKLKVIKNFYEEGGEPRTIVEPTTADVFSTNEGYPESISLAKGPNAVYIGNGSTKSSKSQWLGEIQHEQFGNALDGYYLEEAELKAIDDGQAVYSLNHLEPPHHSASGATSRVNPHYLIGLNPDGRYFYAMQVRQIAGGNCMGKQYRSEDNLGWVPTAMGSSKTLADYMESSDSDHFPFASGAWDGDNSSTNNGHDAQSSYFFTAREGFPDEIRAISLNLKYDSATPAQPEKLNHIDFGVIGLTHNIEVDDNLARYTNLTSGQKVSRKPKSGAFISDIMEKSGKLYIQYSHKSGFTFDEEWLYVINIQDIMDLPTQLPTGGAILSHTINAKPVTPPAMKVKNWGNDNKNWGKDWYMSSETFDGNGLSSMSWIGQDGIYGSYANYIKWRNCDLLGFRSNGQHTAYDRNIDKNDGVGFVSVEKDESGGWKKVFASYVDFFSDDEPMNAWGYSVSDTSNGRLHGNPCVSTGNGINDLDIGPSFGYETYSVFPKVGGLFNYKAGETVDGDIGIAVYMDAKQVTTGIDIKKGRKSTQSWLTYKRKHNFYNTTEPVIEDIDEMRVLTTNHESFGVSQRLMPLGTTHKKRVMVFDSSDEEDNSYSHAHVNVSSATAFANVNGVNTSDWPNSSTGQEGSYNLNSLNSRVAPQRNAFRCGIYAGIFPSGNEPSDAYQRMYNRLHIKLDTATSAQSGMPNNDVTASAPNDSSKMFSVGKMYNSNETFFLTTSKTKIMSPIDTYISRWLVSRPSGNVNGKHNFSTDSTYNPMKIPNLGNAIIATEKLTGLDGDVKLYSSPTAGTFQTGYSQIVHGTGSSTDGTYSVVGSTDTYTNRFDPYADGALTVGLSASFSSPTVAYNHDDDELTDDIFPDASFMNGVTYYYKMTLLYDGYQEGPLSAYSITAKSTTGPNYEVINVTLDISSPPKRASHICLYRKNHKNDFYRLVKEVDLASGWAYNSERDLYTKVVADEGQLGATYEAITGLSEALFETTINYKLSTVAQGHLIVGDCYHPEIKQGQNFIFKSEPNAFSNFNWAKNYCVLPSKPTAIAWFAGKLFAFDLSNMFRVNLDNLVLEDTFEGTGCIGPDSLVITDLGMFFCDYQGMYVHNGDKADNISHDIASTSIGTDATQIIEDTAAEDEAWDSHAWQDINHNVPPKVLYDAKTLTVYFVFQDKHRDGTLFNGAWKYGVSTKRWDLQETGKALGVLSGNRNDIYISGDDQLVQMDKNGKERKLWSWHSKHLDFGLASQDKTYASLRIIFNNIDDASLFKTGGQGEVVAYVDEGLKTTKVSQKKNVLDYKLVGDKKGKKLQFKLIDMALEVDSVAIVYKTKNIK